MGLEAIYQKPNLSRANAAHRGYPYLLRHLVVERPNQVWAMDITYVPIQGGYIYLCAVIDWYSLPTTANFPGDDNPTSPRIAGDF
jgi:putative transposase